MITVKWKGETICAPDEPAAREDFSYGGTVFEATGYMQGSSDQKHTRKILWRLQPASVNPPATWKYPDKVFDLATGEEI